MAAETEIFINLMVITLNMDIISVKSKVEPKYQGVLYRERRPAYEGMEIPPEGVTPEMREDVSRRMKEGHIVYRILVGAEGHECVFKGTVVDFVDISNFMDRERINKWVKGHIEKLKKEGREVYL